MSTETPQELQSQNLANSASLPGGSLRRNAVATSSKILTIEPYFWWTKKQFAWDIASHPWREPAEFEETSSPNQKQYLLRDIRNSARAQKDLNAPWTPGEWSSTVKQAVQTVLGQSQWSEYKVKLLPMTTKQPLELRSPVRQNETWRKELAEQGTEGTEVAFVRTFMIKKEVSNQEDIFLRSVAYSARKAVREQISTMMDEILTEWCKGARTRERLTLIDTMCELEWPDRANEICDYWHSRLFRATVDALIENRLDIRLSPRAPPQQLPPPSSQDQDPVPRSLLLFGRLPGYR